MGQITHPLRSVLYVPGENTRALKKVSTLEADALILDLEDGVAPAKKKEARENLKSFLKSAPPDKDITVRVNGLGTQWVEDDLRAFRDEKIDAIVFPKIESHEDAMAAEGLIEEAGFAPKTRLWFMIETPLGVLNIAQITRQPTRLECLVMGTNDLVKELHARHTPTREPILFSLSLCLLAARAGGLSVIDGVHIDIKDSQGFMAACRQGAELGFDGKTVIHPSQIEGANDAFSPSEDELEEARKIVLRFEEAQREGKAVTLVGGKLVEALHVENAQRLLALAEKIKR